MTLPDDPDDAGGPLGYGTREGPVPKLVVVAIVWAAFGVFGLFGAMLMHSSGFAVFGVLCIVAGIALYFGQRTRDQLAYDEMHLDNDPWSPPSDEPAAVDDERPTDEDTTAFTRHDRDDDILDAEFTEWFDYDQSPADQDDGTGYDDEEMAYQRYQAGQWARSDEDDDAAHDDADDEADDVARTSHIPTGGADEPDAFSHDHNGHGDHEGSDTGDHEGSGGRRR